MNSNSPKITPRTPDEAEKDYQAKLKKIELSRIETQYRIKRKAAKKEENLDYYGEEDVPTKGREEFYQLLKDAYRLGKYIPEKDLIFIKNALYTHPDFISKEKLWFIIQVENRIGGLPKVEETVIDFISLLRETEYHKPLLAFKKWIDTKKISSRIKQLRSQGVSTDKIADKLHITSAEVGVYADNSKEMPNLFDNNSR